MDMVSRMKVRKYEFIESPGNERIGFLAQELQSVFPQAVSGDPEGDVTEEPMGVAYGRLTPVLVEAVQELKAENDALKKSVQEQEKTIAKLIDRLNELEQDVKLEGSLTSMMK
jgi:predicted RNase H-like nuclease (RuvC/YqgF family)